MIPCCVVVASSKLADGMKIPPYSRRCGLDVLSSLSDQRQGKKSIRCVSVEANNKGNGGGRQETSSGGTAECSPPKEEER
jgi:hypothetical protein